MNKFVQLIGVIISLILLVSVRAFQEYLFFDPYLAFFKNQVAFENTSLNEKSYEIMTNIGYRYLLNGVFSLALIYFIFRNKTYVFSSFYLLLILFVLLFPVYYYFVMIDFRQHTMIGFYVRRFMIQPIFVLLLIPSFYYLGHTKKNNIKVI